MTTWFPHQHRTANDGITFEGEATGGGGGSGVQVVTVPVSSAQILDLFNTPVVLIPGVAGNMVVVDAAAICYLAGLTPYTVGVEVIEVVPDSQAFVWGGVSTLGFLDQSDSQVSLPNTAATFGGIYALADMADFGVSLKCDTAAPTLGDGTLLVTVSYFLAPTV